MVLISHQWSLLSEKLTEFVLYYRHLQFNFEEVDITAPDNKRWLEEYQFEIPVFHLNGKFLMKHRVNVKLLDRKLKEFEEEKDLWLSATKL